jgi:hypothetical protein
LLADPSTLKKKTKKRNRSNNNNNNNNNILTNGSTNPFLGGDERLHSSSVERSPDKNRTRQTSDAAAPGFERERERERESTKQNNAEMDGRSEHKCRSGSSAFPSRQLTGSPSDRRSNR